MAIELLVPRRRLLVPKPKSYVKLDMAFGVGAGTTLYDKSRYRSHGTIVGASWATGLHGTCLDFDPTIPSYVEIPASYTQLNFTSEAFSIILRAKFDSIANSPYLFNRGNWNTDGYFLYVFSSGQLIFYTFQSGANQLSRAVDGVITTGTWYTLGISRSGTSVKLYINGVDRTTVSGTHENPATCARTAKIGIADNKTTNPLDGKIEFLRIFGGIALSASEHLAWHNALA